MALLIATLAEEIRKFADKDFVGFVGFPATDVDAGIAWANAIDVYVGNGAAITPPVTPLAATGAKEALALALAGISAPGAAIAIFDVAFAAYALALIAGMLPGFVGTPPPLLLSVTPPTIATVFLAGAAGATASVQATAMATLIHAWFVTGTATPSGGGASSPWV